MIGTLAAIGLGVAGVGAAVSAGKQSSAAKQAAQTVSDTSVQTTQMNNDLAREIYGENKATLAPWQQQGQDATGSINSLLELLPGGSGVNMGFDAYKNSTGYNERLKAGGELINGNYAGNGVFNSGARGKALTKYGQDYASGEFGNYVNSLTPRLNALIGTRDLGYNAAAAQTGVASNFSGQVQANNSQNADTLSNAALYKASNTSSPFGSFLSTMGGGLYGYGSGRY
jgi:hypothetical protein